MFVVLLYKPIYIYINIKKQFGLSLAVMAWLTHLYMWVTSLLGTHRWTTASTSPSAPAWAPFSPPDTWSRRVLLLPRPGKVLRRGKIAESHPRWYPILGFCPKGSAMVLFWFVCFIGVCDLCRLSCKPTLAVNIDSMGQCRLGFKPALGPNPFVRTACAAGSLVTLLFFQAQALLLSGPPSAPWISWHSISQATGNENQSGLRRDVMWTWILALLMNGFRLETASGCTT